jgi:hypothetical protein
MDEMYLYICRTDRITQGWNPASTRRQDWGIKARKSPVVHGSNASNFQRGM